MMIKSEKYFIRIESDVMRASLLSKKFTAQWKTSPNDQSRLMTTISELGYNIIKYANSGEITISYHESFGKSYFEIQASDQGPGIPDIELALQNEFSTGGTLGLGLPGIKRLMDEFSIESKLDHGTTVSVRKFL